MMWICGAALIGIVVVAAALNRTNKNIGFPASRKRAEKAKRKNK